jgi:phosphoribosyl 1,2-cyclic phosphate phosphodiesterase
LEVLILDALRYHTHPTHFTIEEANEMSKMIDAKQTYYTHIAHQIKHAECEKELPANCHLAYDGLYFDIS